MKNKEQPTLDTSAESKSVVHAKEYSVSRQETKEKNVSSAKENFGFSKSVRTGQASQDKSPEEAAGFQEHIRKQTF